MRHGYLVVALLLFAAPWPAIAQEKPAKPNLGGGQILEALERTTGPRAHENLWIFEKAGSTLPSERARVERTIHDNICWALTKDRTLIERTMPHDASLFIFNPDSKPTIGWDELAKNFTLWMDPRFKAVTCDIRELRIRFSPSGDAAWWSAILDDLIEWDGKPAGWKDTRWTGVLEKRQDTWLIVQMHFSFASDKVRAETLEAVKKQQATDARKLANRAPA